jgi:alcohol dehydrogenase (NADP+)
VKWHKEKGIHNTAYSPLGNSNPYYQVQVWSRPEASSLPPPTEDPVLIEIAKKYNTTPHQVAYAWGINNGRSVLSKSVIDWQIVANLESDFEMDQEDMDKIATMDKKARFNDPGPLFRFQFYEGLDGYKPRGEHEFPVSDVYGKIGVADTR